jgi:hypothetical protein
MSYPEAVLSWVPELSASLGSHSTPGPDLPTVHRAKQKKEEKNYAINKSTYRLTKDVLIEMLVLVSVIAGS